MNSKNNVVAVSAARTPFSKYGGVLKDTPSVDLAIHVVKEVMQRAKALPEQIEALYLGQTLHAEIANYLNVTARQVVLRAGLPVNTISVTIDRACCSSMTALQMAFKDIRSGEVNAVIAAGVENMSHTPLLAPYSIRFGSGIGNVILEDCLFSIGYKGWNSVAVDAGEVALEYGIDRETLDLWALQSQNRYAEALAQGKFADEIVALDVPQNRGPAVRFEKDEFPKPNTTLENLARLKTIYGSPTITAGNSPGLDSGASAILLMNKEYAQQHGFKPLGEIIAVGNAASEPRNIDTVPALAIKAALAKTNLSLSDIGLIEINEAFAAVPLVSTKILADGNSILLKDLREKTNVNGGAIAIGHPVGASGARLVLTLMYELKRRGGGYGVAAICGGLAQGDAVIVKV